MPSCRRVRADSWMVWQDLRMKREDAAIGWYWTPWMTSWLWVESGAGPWRYGFTDLWKSGLLIASPGRIDAFWG